MLKHILTGQPATASRHQNGEFNPNVGTSSSSALQQHQHMHQDHLLHHQHQHHQHHHHHNHQHRSNNNNVRGGGGSSSVDVYDTIGLTSPSVSHIRNQSTAGIIHTTPSSSSNNNNKNNPLNHSQLSVNNISQRFNHSHGLNLSNQLLSTSKHSVDSGASPVVGNLSSLHIHPIIQQQLLSSSDVGAGERPKVNGGLDITRLSRLPSLAHTATPSPAPGAVHSISTANVNNPVIVAAGTTGVNNSNLLINGPSIVPLNTSMTSTFSQNNHNNNSGNDNCRQQQEATGVTSLGLLCLVSLLLALLSLIFLLKISPQNTDKGSSFFNHDDSAIVYDVTLVLCALALSLNLCCLLVCAIQFLFAVKLVKSSSYHGNRTNNYLQKSSISRVCAVGGFFISIPVFLTGMILYTFIQFHSTPAIVTSVFIGIGIIFCGCAMVHNVFVWQREKTNAVNALAREQCEAAAQLQRQQMQQQQQQEQHRHNHHLKQQQQQAHHHHQQRGVSSGGNHSINNLSSSRGPKIGTLAQTHSSATLPSSHGFRSQSYHPHNHHNVSSIPIATSNQNNLHPSIGSHRNVATPPTPGVDLSPPSPSHKHNRSHIIIAREISGSVSPGLPAATLDLSSAATTNSPHELSTLV